ncbi:hypothetical protein BH24ACT5_BH24ACT5_12490 [soil metagenome]
MHVASTHLHLAVIAQRLEELHRRSSTHRAGERASDVRHVRRHTGPMGEQFDFQDLSDAVFWGVDLQRATFRAADLMGARISHARPTDVVIDAEIDRLVVNGVDVTLYVNARDEWFALRSQLRPTEPDRMRQGWHAFHTAWANAIERARGLPEELCHASVDGEWSFVETIRHLVCRPRLHWRGLRGTLSAPPLRHARSRSPRLMTEGRRCLTRQHGRAHGELRSLVGTRVTPAAARAESKTSRRDSVDSGTSPLTRMHQVTPSGRCTSMA